MIISLYTISRLTTALIVGTLLGGGFGTIQTSARLKNEKLDKAGKLKSGWTLMPGAGARVAYFLVGLLVFQYFCPYLFTDGVQWAVLSGVAFGYGWMLFRQLSRLRVSLRNGVKA